MNLENVGRRPRYGGGGPDTGGVDLGAMANVGATYPGLHGLGIVTSDVAPAVLTAYMRQRQRVRKAAKDYNDSPTDTTVGTQGGNVMKEPPTEFDYAPKI